MSRVKSIPFDPAGDFDGSPSGPPARAAGRRDDARQAEREQDDEVGGHSSRAGATHRVPGLRIGGLHPPYSSRPDGTASHISEFLAVAGRSARSSGGVPSSSWPLAGRRTRGSWQVPGLPARGGARQVHAESIHSTLRIAENHPTSSPAAGWPARASRAGSRAGRLKSSGEIWSARLAGIGESGEIFRSTTDDLGTRTSLPCESARTRISPSSRSSRPETTWPFSERQAGDAERLVDVAVRVEDVLDEAVEPAAADAVELRADPRALAAELVADAAVLLEDRGHLLGPMRSGTRSGSTTRRWSISAASF